MEDNFTAKLRHCSFMLFLKFFILYSKKHNTHSKHERSDKIIAKWSLHLQEVKNNEKSFSCQPQIVTMVTYRKWFFIKGFNCEALTGNVLVFWITGTAFGR